MQATFTHQSLGALCSAACLFVAAHRWDDELQSGVAAADEPSARKEQESAHPLSGAERARLKQQWDDGITELSKTLDAKPDDVSALSKRGDWYFFRGDFKSALRDYQKMCDVNAELEPAHWRLGLAYFYAEQFETSAKFFDRFFQTDDVDREGGLWKFLAQAKFEGPEQARAGLLSYTKADREPMPTVYRLFEETITADDLLKTADDPKLSQLER